MSGGVLVVDEALIAEAVEEALTEAGYEVCGVADSQAEPPLEPRRKVDLKIRLGVSGSRMDARAPYWRIMVGDSG